MITTSEIIFAILGSGAFAGAISSIFNYFSNKDHQTRRLKINYIEKQLSKLYGPICYFLGQNELIIAHINLTSKKSVEKAQENQFGYMHNQIMDLLTKDNEVIKGFSSILIENNNQIMKILKDGWSLIDLSDIETFQDFQLNVIRFETELDGSNFPKLSLLVSNELPEIMKNYPQYISRIKTAFESKQRDLKTLRTNSKNK